MTAAIPNRGGASVGQLSHMDGLEAACVIYFRLWAENADSRNAVRDDFTIALGGVHGAAVTRAWEELMGICTHHARRPLMRHALTCKCLGADESCFANFIAAAAEGAHEDALLMATLLVRVDMAPVLTSLACKCGLALKRMSLAAPRDMARQAPESRTLH